MIAQSSSITGSLPSDCLESYIRTLIERGVLPLCRGAVGVFYSPRRPGKELVSSRWSVKRVDSVVIDRPM